MSTQLYEDKRFSYRAKREGTVAVLGVLPLQSCQGRTRATLLSYKCSKRFLFSPHPSFRRSSQQLLKLLPLQYVRNTGQKNWNEPTSKWMSFFDVVYVDYLSEDAQIVAEIEV